MTAQPWTIDSIAHALPHPELRATFHRETSFTDVRQLPAILDRWIRVVEEIETARPRLEQLRAYIKKNGHPPAEWEATLVEVSSDDLLADIDPARGAA